MKKVLLLLIVLVILCCVFGLTVADLWGVLGDFIVEMFNFFINWLKDLAEGLKVSLSNVS